MKEQTKANILAILNAEAAGVDEQLAKLNGGREVLTTAIKETEEIKCED